MPTALKARPEDNSGETAHAKHRYLEYLRQVDFTAKSEGDREGLPHRRADPLETLFRSRASADKVVGLPEFKPLQFRPTEFFAAIQEWEGVVREIKDNTIFADLYDLASSADTPTQLAEISFSDIDEKDHLKAKPGAIFRWLVGRSRTRAGSTSGKWVIYFRPPVRGRQSIYDTIHVPDIFADSDERGPIAHGA